MITIIAIIFFYIAPIVLIIKTASLFVLLLTIGIWIIDTIVLWHFCDWYEEVGTTTPKLSYRAFIKLYNVMPNDFELRRYDFCYKNIIADLRRFLITGDIGIFTEILRSIKFNRNKIGVRQC